MAIEWVFFDAGNTLIGLDYSLLLRALASEGLALTETDLRRAEPAARRDLDRTILQRWGRGTLPRTGWVEQRVWRAFWLEVLLRCGADVRRAGTLVEAVLRVTRPAASWDRIDPAAPLALEDLSARGFRLGIISNSSGSLAAHLRRLGLAGRFEVIVDSSEVGVEKPHPEIFHLALDRAGGVPASRALYVGDVYAIDVLGAAGAGLHAVLFDPLGYWDGGCLPDGAPACRTVASLADLPALLGRDEVR